IDLLAQIVNRIEAEQFAEIFVNLRGVGVDDGNSAAASASKLLRHSHGAIAPYSEAVDQVWAFALIQELLHCFYDDWAVPWQQRIAERPEGRGGAMERAETGFDDLCLAADAKDVRVEPGSPRRLRVRPDICDIACIVFQWVSARYEDDLFSHFRVD